MKHEPVAKGKRRPVNITLSAALVDEARALGVNVSRACEAGLAEALEVEARRVWQEEHRAAIEANNVWVERNGLPLERYRLF